MYIFSIVVLFLWILRLNHRIDLLEGRSLPQVKKLPLASGDTSAEKKQAEDAYMSKILKIEEEVPSKSEHHSPIKPRSEIDHEFEFNFGGKFFTVVGSIAVLLGIGSFLRYAFQIGLITETMRVVLGLVLGALLIGVGVYVRRRYQGYGEILVGTGFGALYLSIFAAYGIYHLISHIAALASMFAVTAAGIYFGYRARSIYLTAFSALGAYLTPCLLGTIQGNPHALLVYILIVGLGILTVARRREWYGLSLGSFVGFIGVYLLWFNGSYTSAQWLIASGYLFLAFLLYLASTLLGTLKNTKQFGPLEILFVLNPFVCAFQAYSIINPLYPDSLGFAALCLGLFYLLLFAVAQREARIMLSQLSLVMALFFFFVAVPLQFDQFSITVGWALEALVFATLARQYGLRWLGIVSQSLFIIVGLRLLAFDLPSVQVSIAWLNDRIYQILLVIIPMIVAYLLNWQTDNKKTQILPWTVLIAEAYAFLVYAIALETHQFYSMQVFLLTLLILGLFGCVIALVLREIAVRILGYGLLFCTAIFIFGKYGLISDASESLVFNLRFGMFTAVMVVSALLIFALKHLPQVSAEEKAIVEPISYSIILVSSFWVITLEVIDYYHNLILEAQAAGLESVAVRLDNIRRVALSITWLVYSFILLGIGVMTRSAQVRSLALALLLIVIGKVFVYDTANLDSFYRFISFISLGFVLLIIGYIYHRYQDRIRQFIKVD